MGRKVRVDYEEVVRSGAQKEFDIARRRVFGRGAAISALMMAIGLLVGGTTAYYMGWLGYPGVSQSVRTAFLMGCLITLVFSLSLLVPGAIAVYRRHLVRVNKRTEAKQEST